MKHLFVLNKYFWKYRYRLILGIFFVATSNYFAVIAPEITGYVVAKVQQLLSETASVTHYNTSSGIVRLFTIWVNRFDYQHVVLFSSLLILLLAILKGVLMFFMRQTIIVMSRHIEYEQKNEVYRHYQQMDAHFFKTNRTGDLMNRISEDVSRVRSYTGPALMYLTNLTTLLIFCLYNMFSKDVYLAFLALSPLPLLAILIYKINMQVHKKSEMAQAQLSVLTTSAQETYAGIRVIKSFVQERAMLQFFKQHTEEYRSSATALAKVDALYFPSMTLLIGISILITILQGGIMAMYHPEKVGVVVEFVMYINMMIFAVSAIGWVAGMIQRAAASQKRLNAFLHLEPAIQSASDALKPAVLSPIVYNNVSFRYANTGVLAMTDFSLTMQEGDKVLILGKTGSGKTTLAQLLLRLYDIDSGSIAFNGVSIRQVSVPYLRSQISYAPQDVFLFSDTIANNIAFGAHAEVSFEQIVEAAKKAAVHDEIMQMEHGYDTLVGERGIALSGGQKQRVAIARALLKDAPILLLDDCLSAVDTKTETTIASALNSYAADKTMLIIAHRIPLQIYFDTIVVLENGRIKEQGTHDSLMVLNGYYAEEYRKQTNEKTLS